MLHKTNNVEFRLHQGVKRYGRYWFLISNPGILYGVLSRGTSFKIRFWLFSSLKQVNLTGDLITISYIDIYWLTIRKVITGVG